MLRWPPAAVLLLAACSPAGDAPADPPSAVAAPTTSSEGLPPGLAVLTPDDYAADPLSGELACAFTADGGTLLAMRGNVADRTGRAEGLVKVGARRLLGQADEPGGYDGLPDGTGFSADGLTIAVELVSNTPLAGGESPPYPARLIARWATGTERTYEGTWTCGP
ncbi:MAG: hypothetical protein B7Z08_09920 [Sphingomonadales bacterium 32-68-7]|nr:MAG: hypothetical protein B7Z33_00300 [Sphingomonadales bacterium 12-68-11]OYX08371.1 MAG: hypothetical protein B7Z08_09920 [Sphingomonadales bacterium 32-68-7]